MSIFYQERKNQIRNILKNDGLDIILFYNTYHNPMYSLWIAGIRPLVYDYYYITPKESGFFEINYLVETINKITTEKIIPVVEDDISTNFFEYLNKYKNIGIVGDVPINHLKQLKDKNYYFIEDKIGFLMNQKSPIEIEGITQSAKIVKNILNDVPKYLKPGITEIELAHILRLQLLKEGEHLAFPLAITSGPRIKDTTASFPVNRRITKKDIIAIDMGVVKDGFASDSTRMYFLNNSKLERLYNKFVGVHKKVITQIKINDPIKKAVSLYKYELEVAGFDPETLEVADLGHSVGFYVHERPFIYEKIYQDYKFVENMVFTLEPEIIVNNIRIRIEDMLLVTKKGLKVLT